LTVLQAITLLLVAFGGAAVVLTRHVKRQALVLSFFGMLLTLLFMSLQAPDVALSELAVGSAALPLMLLGAQAAIARERQRSSESPKADE